MNRQEITKRIIQFIKSFPSDTAAADALGMDTGNLAKYIKGDRIPKTKKLIKRFKDAGCDLYGKEPAKTIEQVQIEDKPSELLIYKTISETLAKELQAERIIKEQLIAALNNLKEKQKETETEADKPPKPLPHHFKKVDGKKARSDIPSRRGSGRTQ
jgi:hypothetical protein